MNAPPEIADLPGLQQFEPVPVVYFLSLRGAVVYVGQSICLSSRLGAHTAKEYDAVHFVRCAREEMTRLEVEFIQRLQPPLNSSHLPGPLRRKRAAQAAFARLAEHRKAVGGRVASAAARWKDAPGGVSESA